MDSNFILVNRLDLDNYNGGSGGVAVGGAR